MTIKERLLQEIDILNDSQLHTVECFIESLKKGTNRFSKALTDEAKLAALYYEFENEDKILAEGDMNSYFVNLNKEDKN